MHFYLLEGWKSTQDYVHSIAKAKGWWSTPREDGTALALMHSELSEALEALRQGNPPSEKAQGFSQVEEELADVVIRIMDYAAAKGLDIPGALFAKAVYNEGRAFRHGGKAF